MYSRPTHEIKDIFNRIAPRYDFLNSFLSFNSDKGWRKKAVELGVTGSPKSILDIGTGSGAFLEEFLNSYTFERAVGMDLSSEMLALARKRLGSKADLLLSDGPEIPFQKNKFDLVSAAFVLRSISNLPQFFDEVYRVLRPGGRFVILELTRPNQPVMKMLYRPYLKWYLPLVGRLISGSWNAYQFLSSSIQKFYEVGESVDFLKQAGFNSIQVHSLTGGVCTLVIADKTK